MVIEQTVRKVETLKSHGNSMIKDASGVSSVERQVIDQASERHASRIDNEYRRADAEKQREAEEGKKEVQRNIDMLNALRESRADREADARRSAEVQEDLHLTRTRQNLIDRKELQQEEHGRISEKLEESKKEEEEARNRADKINETKVAKQSEYSSHYESKAEARKDRVEKVALEQLDVRGKIELDGEAQLSALAEKHGKAILEADKRMKKLQESRAYGQTLQLEAAAQDETYADYQDECRRLVKKFNLFKQTFSKEEQKIAVAIRAMSDGGAIKLRPDMTKIFSAYNDFSSNVQNFPENDATKLSQSMHDFDESVREIGATIEAYERPKSKDISEHFKKAKECLKQLSTLMLSFNKEDSTAFNDILHSQHNQIFNLGTTGILQALPGASDIPRPLQ